MENTSNLYKDRLCVWDKNGDFCIQVEINDTIECFKKKLSTFINVPYKNIEITLCQKVIPNDHNMKDYLLTKYDFEWKIK